MPYIGIGIRIGASSVPNAVVQTSAFQSRVIADGGTVEAYSCLVTNITNWDNVQMPVTDFNLRVQNDSGTYEAVNCLQTFIDAIN